ncbi:MAG: hypothetical protein US13_C0001G0142 [candidate division TM6 bacterium GW2011_GWE2_36_25]|nr:MAG: hypothetical protein US03_C0001G0062 [candidate division TM6 bacterium GW2011_GWF2_36_131]KKQ03802.1 MAG: hypothetical protein US13_C0001G0142 [candidate division TM6 bacterium GW2011_GWE2_36_25]KKQ19948.1 MAG: hypothetical protein US32_C0003G0065 [candidate division TM6 bacterium GW2011_GWA2_36_9]
MFRYARFFLGTLLLISGQSLCATLALDFIKPYDRYLWTNEPKSKGTFQIDVYGASSFHERGVRWDHTKICNVLQIWQCDQNALAMVQGFDPNSTIGQLAAELNGISDDGVRGHLIPSAHFHMAEFGISGKYWLPHGFSLGLFFPFVRMQLNNVKWCDCTKEQTEADLLTKDLLTGNLAQNVCNLGGPDICSGWKRTGIGDVSAVLRWEQDFPQSKPILTNVLLSLYLGLSLPTGKTQDEDRLFALPFGYDGSPGILFGGSLNLVWKHHFCGGVDLNFTQLMGDTRLRRVKTSYDQTELLLLAKTSAHIDWGFLQRYRLYLGANNIIRGFSFDVNYQFQKQGNNILTICTNDYISTIANSAESLKQWTIHQFGVDLSYDFGFDFAEDARLTPSIIFFYRKAFKGCRAILADKWGFSFVFSF